MNINKKLKRINSSIFKIKTNIDTYAIAIKKERFERAEETQNARREFVAKTKQQKNSYEVQKKKNADDENQQRNKKSVYTTFIYQESHAETDHNEEKKEERVIDALFIQRRSEIACKFRRNQNTNKTRFDVDK
jgi:hypothetical protein